MEGVLTRLNPDPDNLSSLFQLLRIFVEALGLLAGAGEDVEGVLARLNTQSAENALLRERQAKANSDMQVRV